MRALLVAAALFVAAPAFAADAPATSLTLADAAKADKAKYKQYAAGQLCSNCALYKGKATDAAGGCGIFPGKQVAGKGWCSAYAKKG